MSVLCLISCPYLCRSYIFVLTIELNVRVAPDGGEKKWKCANRTSFKHHVSKLPFSVTILDYWQIVMGWWLLESGSGSHSHVCKNEKSGLESTYDSLTVESVRAFWACGLWCLCLVQFCIIIKSWVYILCITTFVRLFIGSFSIPDYFRAQVQNMKGSLFTSGILH